MGATLTFTRARVIAPGPLPGHRVLSAVIRNEDDAALSIASRDLILRAADGSVVPGTAVFDERRSNGARVSPKHAVVEPRGDVAVVVAWRRGPDGREAVVLEHPGGSFELEHVERA